MKQAEEELITVVVPVYNAGPWLGAALESLRSQSHARFEAILVDDGSSDGSSEICRRYAEEDSRFLYFRQDNDGVSAARNKGIDLSSGEWIAFMDADDLLPSDSLLTLLSAAKETGCLIVAGEYSKKSPEPKSSKKGEATTVPSEEAIRIGLYQKRILNNPWGMLFHRSVFSGPDPLRFRKCRYEDLDLFYRAFERVPRICLADTMVYYYRDNPGSFINTWSDSRLDALDVTDRIVEHMKKHHPSLLAAALDRRFSAHCNILAEMVRRSIRNRSAFERCMRVIREQRVAELRDPEVRLKNKLGALASYPLLPAIRMLCE